MAEQLYGLNYPFILFILPKPFLRYRSKNDLKLKLKLIQSLVVQDQKKKFDIQELFDPISLSSSRMVQIKTDFVQLLQELVLNINELEIIYKNGKESQITVEKLTANQINRRIRYLKFNQNIRRD